MTNRPIPLRPDPDAKRDAGMASLTRAAITVGLRKLGQDVRQKWDDRGVDLIMRAAVAPAALTNSPGLTQIAVAFLETLTPMSAGAELLNRGIGLNFDGAAQITVPNIAIPNASFVGEGKPIPVQKAPTTPGPTLSPHKLAVIAALTGEMMRSINSETMVRQALLESTGPALDAVLFSANAATTDAPAGLLNGIAPLNPAGVATERAQNIVDDLQALAQAVAPVASNGDLCLVAAPAQAVAIALRSPREIDWPLMTSASLAAGTVIAVAANAVVSAIEGAPAIDAASEASIHYETVPGEIVDIGGVSARPVGSMYQTDVVALRLRWPICWGLRDQRGLAWMQNVNWVEPEDRNARWKRLAIERGRERERAKADLIYKTTENLPATTAPAGSDWNDWFQRGFDNLIAPVKQMIFDVMGEVVGTEIRTLTDKFVAAENKVRNLESRVEGLRAAVDLETRRAASFETLARELHGEMAELRGQLEMATSLLGRGAVLELSRQFAKARDLD